MQQYNRLFFHFLFCLLLTGLPFSKAMVSIAFVGLLILSFFLFFQKKPAFSIEGIKWTFPPIVLFMALGLSLLYSDNLSEGLNVLLSNAEMVGLPIILFLNRKQIKERFLFYLDWITIITVVAVLITIAFFFFSTDLSYWITLKLPFLKEYIIHEKQLAFGAYSPFIDRLQFAYLIAVVLMALMWQFFRVRKDMSLFRGGIRIFQMVILLSGLLILGSRGAQLALLPALFVWALSSFKKFYITFFPDCRPVFYYLGLVSSLFLFFVVLPVFAYQKIPAVKTRYDQLIWETGTFRDGTFKNYEYTHFTSIRRLLSWRNSLEIIVRHPLTGVGIGDYQQEMERQYAQDQLGFPVNTQSQFLYYWTSSGLIALFAFLGLLFFPVYQVKLMNNRLDRMLLLSFSTFFFFVFLFDAPLNFQVGSMSYFLFYGLLTGFVGVRGQGANSGNNTVLTQPD